MNISIWDLGGQQKIRCLWKSYYSSTNAIIFVVDSNTFSLCNEIEKNAKYELHYLLQYKEVQNIPVLIYANKQDMPNAMDIDKVKHELNVDSITTNECYIQLTSAKNGEGLYEGLEWLSQALRRH